MVVLFSDRLLGKQKTFFVLLGNTVGLGIIALISALGVGTLVLKSSSLTAITTIAGVCWLCYMGGKMISSHATNSQSNSTRILEQSAYHAKRFYSGLVLALTNPKPLVFFVSIYPQFVDATREKNMQLLLLGVTFMCLSIVVLNTYSLVSNATVGKVLNEWRARLFNVIFGVVFIVIGILLIIPIVNNASLYFQVS